MPGVSPCAAAPVISLIWSKTLPPVLALHDHHVADLIPRETNAMSTLTKLALGAMGQLRPRPAQGDAVRKIALPAPDKAHPKLAIKRSVSWHG